MSLPRGQNFAGNSFTYTYNGAATPTTYTLQVTALDNAGTQLFAMPDSVWQQ
jgi:hypothetical protein